jgi:hypothetical protein
MAKYKLEGYVCNTRGCRKNGHPHYIDEDGKTKKECPACKEKRTELLKEERKTSNKQAKDVFATPMSGGSSMRGKAYYERRSDK